MTDSNGNLSVDFMAGFTIFMIAFIWVATLVPNLFLGVSAHGVDFDAVAYRTCVILTEDPGASAVDTPWESQPDTAKTNVQRFGLAISKATPNILSQPKIDRFFNKTAGWTSEDYRNKTIFGDYPYRFNISLRTVDDSIPVQYVGDVRPDNYGFMRREVKIKHFGNATLDNITDYTSLKLYNHDVFVSPDTIAQADGNVTSHNFAITINMSKLRGGNVSDPLINPNYRDSYSIDPYTDWINITMEDLNTTPQISRWVDLPQTANINLSKVEFWQSPFSPTPSLYVLAAGTVPQKDFIYVDGNPTPVNPPVKIQDNGVVLRNNITLAFPPGFFVAAQSDSTIYVNLTFGVEKEVHTGANDWQGMQYLNTTQSQPWDYSYNATLVSQPYLTDGVLEVAVW
jgi:hypothetical protein